MRSACVCQGAGLREVFRADLDRYIFEAQDLPGVTGRLAALGMGLLAQGLWATTAYRVRHYARHRRHSALLDLVSFFLQRFLTALTSIDIDANAHIGPGLWIPHAGYVVIGPVRMGRNCEIFQGVTLGESESTLTGRPRGPGTAGRPPGVPALGDRVWVGPGAVIAGAVTVGDDASIGANSLVVRDVPPRGVVLGVPARLVSRQGSFGVVTYRGMDGDTDRQAALAAAADGGTDR